MTPSQSCHPSPEPLPWSTRNFSSISFFASAGEPRASLYPRFEQLLVNDLRQPLGYNGLD